MADAANTAADDARDRFPVQAEPRPPVPTDPDSIERGLKPEFRDGLAALREYADLSAEAIEPVTRGNDQYGQVFVCLGVWDLPAINDDFTADSNETAVYARLSRNFGQDGNTDKQYGFATHPTPELEGGKNLANVRFGQNHARELADVLDVRNSDLAYWSHDWNDVPVDGGEDMVRVVPVIKQRFENPT
jgi:hypothetical protein